MQVNYEFARLCKACICAPVDLTAKDNQNIQDMAGKCIRQMDAALITVPLRVVIRQLINFWIPYVQG